MQKLTFATGRTYDAPQVLEITVEQLARDEFGICDLVATFTDASRHIKGRVQTIAFDSIGKAVLDAYDAGAYQPI